MLFNRSLLILVTWYQALLCSADLSLEGPLRVTEDKWSGPNGWGGTHLCKDRVAVDEVVRTYGLPQAALIRPAPEPNAEA